MPRAPARFIPRSRYSRTRARSAKCEGDEPRKAFEATPQGRDELDDRKDEAEALVERLSDHGERHAERGKAFATPEMFRALGNLAQVVKIRARKGGLDDDTMEQIVDLIDEMARKIERL